jgi:hypothetical protein
MISASEVILLMEANGLELDTVFRNIQDAVNDFVENGFGIITQNHGVWSFSLGSRFHRRWLDRSGLTWSWLDRSGFTRCWLNRSRLSRCRFNRGRRDRSRLNRSRRNRSRLDRSRRNRSWLDRSGNHRSRFNYSWLNRRRSGFCRRILLHHRRFIFLLGIILTASQKQGQGQAKGKGLDFERKAV